jgi:hypothetical protein
MLLKLALIRTSRRRKTAADPPGRSQKEADSIGGAQHSEWSYECVSPTTGSRWDTTPT